MANLKPTLFIGIGGTGMEVLLRLRRKILNNLWGNESSKVRVDKLTDFPIAQFIHFDLDSGAVVDTGKSQLEDLQFNAVKFTDEEKIVENFDINMYSLDSDALASYPNIESWLSLTPDMINQLGIDPSRGAGQMRAISRLYFFDKYKKTRNKIRSKLRNLAAVLTNAQQLEKLGIRPLNSYRIVVVCSVAGGTGSGAFLDMGWLARWLGKEEERQTEVELMLFLPTGYAGANSTRTEANGYAALMELESAMRGNVKNYVGKWDDFDTPELEPNPYSDVYLIDTGNLAQQQTTKITDVYHMLSDILFENFASADFAQRKATVAVNQLQFKNDFFSARLNAKEYGAMRLDYSKRYSAVGQSVLDTRQDTKRDYKAHLWASTMLKAFFGVGSSDASANRATDKKRIDFFENFVKLKEIPFKELPEFSDKSIELKLSSGEFSDYSLVDDLLSDKNGSLIAGVENRVNDRVDSIKNNFSPKEWPEKVRLLVQEIERDAVKDQDSTADAIEDRISKRRRELLDLRKKEIKSQLYIYLDNEEFGGLEYVLSLVAQIKDKIDSKGNGLIAELQVNSERYKEIKEAVRTREFERLLNNLEQAQGGSWFSSSEKQAKLVLDQLRIEIAHTIKFHLRAKAASEAAIFLNDLSIWLGKKGNVDSNGVVAWSGLLGEFQAGRDAVIEMLNLLDRSSSILQADIEKEHATLIYIESPAQQISTPGTSQMREWANEAFRDFGGSKEIFGMLADTEKKGELLSKARKFAEEKLIELSPEQVTDDLNDPLIDALELLSNDKRAEIFTKWIACAMPWVNANLGGNFRIVSDQYKCFISVGNEGRFSTKFYNQIMACMPREAGIERISFITSGIMGRAVCYCELSGFPLTALSGIEGWRTSYRIESADNRLPVHNHVDHTQFSHPIAPVPSELNYLANEFKYFLIAIMTTILSRSQKDEIPAGQYELTIARGDIRKIGNERSVRLNGLARSYREEIISRVNNLLESADAHLLVAISALAIYYELEVYTPKLVKDGSGIQNEVKGFASTMAKRVSDDLKAKARLKGLSEQEIDELINKLKEDKQLVSWTKQVPNSNLDAYESEVRDVDESRKPRVKLILNPEVFKDVLNFDRHNMDFGIAKSIIQGVLSTSTDNGTVATPADGVGPIAPPPVAVANLYHVAINGQQTGPFPAQLLIQMIQTGTIPLTSKVWRNGLAEWVEINSLPELTMLSPALPTNLPPPLN